MLALNGLKASAGFIEFAKEFDVLQTGGMYIRTQTADCQVEDVTDDEDQHEGNHADDVEAGHGAQKVKDVCNGCRRQDPAPGYASRTAHPTGSR